MKQWNEQCDLLLRFSAYSRSSVDASLVQRDDVIHELKQKVFEVESEVFVFYILWF